VTKKPRKREELQVTQMMHEKLREELRSNDTSILLSIKALENKILALDKKTDVKFNKMEMMQAKFYEELVKMNAEIAKMNAVNARTLGLVEEQRAENKTIWDKQSQLEEKFNNLI